MTPDQAQKLDELINWKRSLEASSTIPLNVDQAFRDRFSNLLSITSSTKSATSENKSVNEAGVAAYSVLLPPDAFLQVNVGGVVYFIPVFT